MVRMVSNYFAPLGANIDQPTITRRLVSYSEQPELLALLPSIFDGLPITEIEDGPARALPPQNLPFSALQLAGSLLA